MKALDEAIAIALSAKGEVVDWSREPLTQRERKIRARYLENELADLHGRVRLGCMADIMELKHVRVARDLAEAARRADEEIHQQNERARREAIERAIDDFDDQDES